MIKLRKKLTKDGSQSLYLDIYIDGKRTYKFLKLYLTKDRINNKEVMKLAESIRAKYELDSNTQEYGFVRASYKDITLLEYYEKLNPIAIEKKDKNFKATYAHLKKYEKSNVRLRSIDENWLEEFESHLKKTICDNSILTYFNNLKAVLNRALRDKIIMVNPFVYFRKMKKPNVAKSFLTIDEIKMLAITESDNNEIKRAFLFSCYTGLRLCDMTKLTWGNVKGNKLEFKQKKTSEYEYLPLPKTAFKIIFPDKKKVMRNPEDKVFAIPSQQVVSKILKRMAIKAKIGKVVTFHTARHTFATLALKQGVDLYTVSKLLGHTDIKNTQIYAKIVDETKREAMNKMPQIKIN